MGKLYAAYGSNLNLAQMGARCPSARIYATGVLNNWALAYRGSRTNAHATITKKLGSIVPVLIWDIQLKDEYRLDIYEGYPSYYRKRYVMADVNGSKKRVMVYIMHECRLPGKPSEAYIETIRQGYADNNLDMTIFEESLRINSFECI